MKTTEEKNFLSEQEPVKVGVKFKIPSIRECPECESANIRRVFGI